MKTYPYKIKINCYKLSRRAYLWSKFFLYFGIFNIIACLASVLYMNFIFLLINIILLAGCYISYMKCRKVFYMYAYHYNVELDVTIYNKQDEYNYTHIRNWYDV